MKNTLLTNIVDWVEQQGWKAIIDEKRELLLLPMQSTSGEWMLAIHANDVSGFVICHSVLDARTPGDRIEEMKTLVSRLNYGLAIGNFELDETDGEIRFKTSMDTEGMEDAPHPALMSNLVRANLTSMDRFKKSIEAVMSGASTNEALGNMSPKEVLGSKPPSEASPLEILSAPTAGTKRTLH